MKVLLPAGVAAALMVSSAAFAAGPAPVANSTVAPLSGQMHPQAMHQGPENGATQALNLLEANGYGDFTNFHRTGRDYAATVSQNGTTFPVTIDPETGQITRG